jgi:serine/threonine protein kinase
LSVTIGTKLGPYEITSLLGKGGMGEVYRARDTRLERTIALKILPAVVAADPERKRRFVQEAKSRIRFEPPQCRPHLRNR